MKLQNRKHVHVFLYRYICINLCVQTCYSIAEIYFVNVLFGFVVKWLYGSTQQI